MRGLRDKRILIAGGPTGMAAATARRLVEEGARVHLGDLNAPGLDDIREELTSSGGDVQTTHFDLGHPETIAKLVENAVGHLGGLDGVANIAADLDPDHFARDRAVTDMDPAVWERALRVNLIGLALMSKYSLPHLVENGGGSIVNIGSGASLEPLTPDWGSLPAYSASKAGVGAVTRHIALTYGKQGIRANTIHPGMVLSERALLTTPAEVQEHILATQHALPRLGQATDIAQMVVFLLSDESTWITGQGFHVNGGHIYRE